jgi:hypothetical protein
LGDAERLADDRLTDERELAELVAVETINAADSAAVSPPN